jgi:hypothetical protein
MESMIIKLSPQRSDEILTLVKNGDMLRINNQNYDFNPLVEGAVLPMGSINCKFIAGNVTRTNGEVVVTIILPYNVSHSNNRRFPTDLINVPDGPVELPE